MKANYTLHKSQAQLSELLMDLDCDWKREKISERTEENPEQYKFTAVIGKHKVMVVERHVAFGSLSESVDQDGGEFEDTRTLGDGNKYSQLYKSLEQRFREDADIRFFDKIHDDITAILEAQEEESKEQEDDRTLPLLDSRKD